MIRLAEREKQDKELQQRKLQVSVPVTEFRAIQLPRDCLSGKDLFGHIQVMPSMRAEIPPIKYACWHTLYSCTSAEHLSRFMIMTFHHQ